MIYARVNVMRRLDIKIDFFSKHDQKIYTNIRNY